MGGWIRRVTAWSRAFHGSQRYAASKKPEFGKQGGFHLIGIYVSLITLLLLFRGLLQAKTPVALRLDPSPCFTQNALTFIHKTRRSRKRNDSPKRFSSFATYHNNAVQVIKKRGLQYETLVYVNDSDGYRLTFVA